MKKSVALGLARTVMVREAREAIYLWSGLNYTKPSDIKISLTDRCNYRCEYCDHWTRDHYVAEINVGQWIAIVSELKDYLGNPTIQFSGGEPMLSRAFLPLVEHCNVIGVRWGVITNGSLLNGVALQRLVGAHPLNVDISMDSSRAESHNLSRGVPNSLERIQRNLRQLNGEREVSGQSFPIRIKPTVHSRNFDHLCEIVEWAGDIGDVMIDFSPVRLPQGKERSELYVSGDERLARLDLEVSRLIEMKSLGAPIETSDEKLLAICAHFKGEKVDHGNAVCRVGLRTLDIRPNGVVNHCWKFHNVGNLATETSRNIWNRTRQTIAAQAVACEHVSSGRCGTACTAHRSLSQDILRGMRYLGAGGAKRKSG